MVFKIKEVNNEEVNIVDQLLTKLIIDEGKSYDENINLEYKVEGFYQKYLGNEDMKILVAVDDKGSIIGYLFGFIENNGKVYRNSVAKIDALYVEQFYRGYGIAKELVNYFEKWCKVKTIMYIEIDVCKENAIAYNMYKQKGFSPFRINMRKKIKK
ncbi:MAG: GNAT family N-acetyltransferase [Clostridia bacterium]|nr:GNAT family N-acetyltransferase [Clostridia bacterium]